MTAKLVPMKLDTAAIIVLKFTSSRDLFSPAKKIQFVGVRGHIPIKAFCNMVNFRADDVLCRHLHKVYQCHCRPCLIIPDIFKNDLEAVLGQRFDLFELVDVYGVS